MEWFNPTLTTLENHMSAFVAFFLVVEYLREIADYFLE